MKTKEAKFKACPFARGKDDNDGGMCLGKSCAMWVDLTPSWTDEEFGRCGLVNTAESNENYEA